MPIVRSSVRSSTSAVINHAVEVIGRSKQRLSVFRAIYQGKKAVKTVNEICELTGLSRVRVLQEGKWLADNEIVQQIRTMGMTAYRKDNFYSSRKERILRMVQDPIILSEILSPPKAAIPVIVATEIRVPRDQVKVKYITIDDIDTFSRVHKIKIIPEEYEEIPEKIFKRGISRILGEKGTFTDWGGEKNDLYTDKIRIQGVRILAAFAFKGPGTRGILTPKKMGKNGDQIQRLFYSQAMAFIVQYWGQIDQSIIELMADLSKAKSYKEGSIIYYGIIDGDDSNRITKAYQKEFS